MKSILLAALIPVLLALQAAPVSANTYLATGPEQTAFTTSQISPFQDLPKVTDMLIDPDHRANSPSDAALLILAQERPDPSANTPLRTLAVLYLLSLVLLLRVV